jgi:hypothetical protein
LRGQEATIYGLRFGNYPKGTKIEWEPGVPPIVKAKQLIDLSCEMTEKEEAK